MARLNANDQRKAIAMEAQALRVERMYCAGMRTYYDWYSASHSFDADLAGKSQM
jgi:hypothetical protein